MCAPLGLRSAYAGPTGKDKPSDGQSRHPPPGSVEVLLRHDTGRLLESHGEKRHLRPNGVLAQQGQPGERIFAVTSGVLASYRSGAEAKPAVFDFHYPGDLITAAWPDPVSPVTIKALTSGEALSFSSEALEALFTDDPALGFLLFREVGQLLAAQQEANFHQSRSPVEQRAAAFFLDLGLRLGQRRGHCLSITLPMRRAEIASFLGLRSETLSRIMTRWKTDGLLKLEGLRVLSFPRVTDLEALALDPTLGTRK